MLKAEVPGDKSKT